jgi:hypothetical protein
MTNEFDTIAENAGDADLEAWAIIVKSVNEEIVIFLVDS